MFNGFNEDTRKLVILFRSSRSQMFFKIGVLKNVAILIGKYLLYWSLLLKPAILLKSVFNTGVNIETFLRTKFFTVHLLWLFLIFSLLIHSRFLTRKNAIAIKSVLRTLTNFYDKAFWENSYQLLADYYFYKKFYHRCLTRC